MLKPFTFTVLLAICFALVTPFSPTQNAIRLRSSRVLFAQEQPRQNLIVSTRTEYYHRSVTSLAASGEDKETNTEEEEEEGEGSEIESSSSKKELSGLAGIKQKLFPPKVDDGLTFKQKLAKAGLSVVLSYGWVSNVSYSIAVSLAWFIFSKQTGLSPLAPGQWPKFLAVYAGFFVFNNIVRPIRFGISCGVSLYFDRLVQKIQDKFRVKKGVAVFLTVFFANVVGTIALMCSGIYVASLAAGVPVFAK